MKKILNILSYLTSISVILLIVYFIYKRLIGNNEVFDQYIFLSVKLKDFIFVIASFFIILLLVRINIPFPPEKKSKKSHKAEKA